MKAVLYQKFGPTSVLELSDLPAPVAPPDGVLVRVHATSTNVIDSRARRGEMSPFVNKKFPKIPGADFSGVIAAVGPQAKRFRVGEAVFGATNPFNGGAFAEFVAVKEDAIAAKPAALSFEQAAALPVTGLAALYAMRELGKIARGQRVLIYGSSGGAGLFAIQIAKYFGAQITTVSGTAGAAASRDAGADITLDYRKGPVSLSGPYDIIVDFSSHFPFSLARPHLTPGGRFIEASPTIPKFLGSMIANLFRRQKHLMLQTESHGKDLEFLTSLFLNQALDIRIAQVFPLSAARAAYDMQDAGGTIGKVVVSLPLS